jgi:hypothetical protein
MSDESPSAAGAKTADSTAAQKDKTIQQQFIGWRRLLPLRKTADEPSSVDSAEEYKDDAPTEKWSLGILNDKKTREVPGQYIVQARFRSVLANDCCQAPFCSFPQVEMSRPWVFDINPSAYLHPPYRPRSHDRGRVPCILLFLKRKLPTVKYCSIHNPTTL